MSSGRERRRRSLEADSQLDTFLSTNVDKTASLDCAGHVRQQGENALAAMSTGETELFRFYLAMDAFGATTGSGAHFFRDSSVLAAWEFSRAAALGERGSTQAESEGVRRDRGCAVVHGHPAQRASRAGIGFMAEAVVLFGVAIAEQDKADSYTPVIADARSRLSGEGSFGSAVAASGSALARDVDAGLAARHGAVRRGGAAGSAEGSRVDSQALAG